MDRNVYLPLVLRVCRWLRLKPHTEPACRPTEEVSAKCPLGQCRQPVTHNSAGGKKPGIGRGNHTHTHTHTPAHTRDIYACISTLTHIPVRTCMHTHLEHTDMCACIPTCTHTHIYTHLWNTQIFVSVYPHTHMCAPTHVHTLNLHFLLTSSRAETSLMGICFHSAGLGLVSLFSGPPLNPGSFRDSTFRFS